MLLREPGGNFLKLALTRTPDPIRPTRRGSDAIRATYRSKEGGYDLGGLSGGLVGYPCRHFIVPMCCLTGGGPTLQRQPALSNRLAVLACVHCQGRILSSQPSIRPTHLFTVLL